MTQRDRSRLERRLEWLRMAARIRERAHVWYPDSLEQIAEQQETTRALMLWQLEAMADQDAGLND